MSAREAGAGAGGPSAGGSGAPGPGLGGAGSGPAGGAGGARPGGRRPGGSRPVARFIGRFLTLAVLVGLGLVLRGLSAPRNVGAASAMLVGFTLLASYVAGGLAADLGLPRLTGYVLVGILVGPFVLGVLGPEDVGRLRIVDRVALALIALTAGGELRIGSLRGELRAITGLSVGVLVAVGVGVTALTLAVRPIVPALAGRPLGVVLAFAVLLGLWSANSSPDATVAVINESGAQGELTETILGTTIFKDVLVIIAFAAALALLRPLVEPGPFDAALLFSVAWEVGGGIALGLVAGLIFGYYLGRIGLRTVLATLAFAFLLTLTAQALHVELLLTAVAAGFAIENFSAGGQELIDAVERNAMVVFALFFALAGATLDLDALRRFWPLALGLVVARGALTWAGARVGARVGAARPVVVRRAWLGLISQAGVTLGLALLVARELPPLGETFVAVTGAAIIVHLLVGPVLLKRALAAAGETGRAG